MVARNFAASLRLTLQFEGGYSDHPADPGGATKYGITQAVLAEWRGRQVSKQEVRDLARSEAEAIYRRNYWDAVGGDELPAGAVRSCGAAPPSALPPPFPWPWPAPGRPAP